VTCGCQDVASHITEPPGFVGWSQERFFARSLGSRLEVRFFRHLPTFDPTSSDIAIRRRRSETPPVRHFLRVGLL